MTISSKSKLMNHRQNYSIVHWASHKLESRLKWAKEINSFHSVLHSSPFFPCDFQSPVSTHETVLLTLFDRRHVPSSFSFVCQCYFPRRWRSSSSTKTLSLCVIFHFPISPNKYRVENRQEKRKTYAEPVEWASTAHTASNKKTFLLLLLLPSFCSPSYKI